MHILIVRNNSNAPAVDASLLLAAYLRSQDIAYTLIDSSELVVDVDVAGILGGQTGDMAVVLGGDGTILRTARLVASSGTPILGINFGRLGFLANAGDEGVVALVAAALAGDVVSEQRANLCIDILCDGEGFDGLDFTGEAVPGDTAHRRRFFALNELAVTRGTRGRVIDFRLAIAGVPIAEMRGDGLVVATATGSTAYALSAGGPLVAPGFDGLVVVPLAPHSLCSRAIVTASSDIVEVDLACYQENREATLFADGEVLSFERPAAKVLVRKGPVPTTLLRHQSAGFYEYASEVFF